MQFWNELVSGIFNDPAVHEVLVNGSHGMQVLSSQTFWHPSPFQSAEQMRIALQDLAHGQGIRLDPLVPAAGGLLVYETAAGNLHVRWHCLLPPIARDGPLLSLRRHRFRSLRLADFAASDVFSMLQERIDACSPLFVIGPTGAGKTSLLIALLEAFASDLRVAILEQIPEIPRLVAAWIRVCAQSPDVTGKGQFTLTQVFDELLRLRPDRVVVGEVRQDEANVLKRALLAGHGGIWCTLHAGAPRSVAARLADLSRDPEAAWQEILEAQRAIVLVLQRERPRLREAWQCVEKNWQLIFCAKEK